MDKRILTVFDSEEGYAYRLMEFISNKDNLPFEIFIFTDEEKFYSFMQSKEVECLLISETDYRQEVEALKIPHIMILSESNKNLNQAFHHINKYQSCENIFHEIMKYYTDQNPDMPISMRATSRQMKIIGVYTPVGRCLQTTFSLTMGQILAREHKTLYLNFEIYSGFSRMLNKTFDSDISDLMYYFECAREKLIYRLESMVENINGLDFIPPAEIYHSLAGIRGEQWKALFAELQRTSEYEYLILDLSDGIMDLWEVLRSCDKIYTISKGDGLAMAKVEQYEKALENMEYTDINRKTSKCQLPIFKSLPADFRELTYGELAGYIRKQILPEVMGEKEDG